jgi:hypothetical protein
MISTKNQTNINLAVSTGFKALENHLNTDDYVYVLRYLYGMVRKLKIKKAKKSTVMRWVQGFEKKSELPGFLSSLSIDHFLQGLEDELYLNGIQYRSIRMPFVNTVYTKLQSILQADQQVSL